jgi:hypothetical protein
VTHSVSKTGSKATTTPERSPTAGNAVKHGIFVKSDSAAAVAVLRQPPHFASDDPMDQEDANDLARAEANSRHCGSAVLHQLLALEALIAAAAPFAAPISLDKELRTLTRLLRYQSESSNRLRNRRIDVLNAAEGIFVPRRLRGFKKCDTLNTN